MTPAATVVRGRRALCALAVLALSGGCAGPEAHRLPDPLPTDVPFAYHLQTTSGSDGALLEGTLELRDGCLVVLPEYEGMEAPVVPVVPIAVSSWDGTTFTVNGESADLGESIALGGGYHDGSGADLHFLPAGCPEAESDGYFTVGIR